MLFHALCESWPLTGSAHRPSRSLTSSAPLICRKPILPYHTPIPCKNSPKRNKIERKKREKSLSGIAVGGGSQQCKVPLRAAALGSELSARWCWKAHKCNEVPVTPAPLHSLNQSHWSTGNWGFKNTNYSNCLLCYWEDCNKRGAQHCRAMS